MFYGAGVIFRLAGDVTIYLYLGTNNILILLYHMKKNVIFPYFLGAQFVCIFMYSFF